MPSRRTFLSIVGLLGAAGMPGRLSEGAIRRRRGYRGSCVGTIADIGRGPSTAPAVKQPEFIQPKGHWRVRAENQAGRSAWSEYRGFEFTT